MPQIELTVRNVFWQGRACDLLVSGGCVLELTEPGREQTGKLAVYNLATIGLFVCAVSYAMYTAWALLPFRFGERAY